MKIQNPHDRFFRHLISQKARVKDFVQYSLSPKLVQPLRLETLTPLPDSFVDEALRACDSDAWFQVMTRKGLPLLLYMLLYLLQQLGSEHREDAMKQIQNELPEGEKIMLSIADKLREEGLKQGIEQGREEGREAGLKNGIHRALQVKFHDTPATLLERINAEPDLSVLLTIMDQAIAAQSLQNFQKQVEPLISRSQ